MGDGSLGIAAKHLPSRTCRLLAWKRSVCRQQLEREELPLASRWCRLPLASVFGLPRPATNPCVALRSVQIRSRGASRGRRQPNHVGGDSPVSRRSVGNTSKQPYFHLSACRRSSRAGIQSAIQGEWVFTRRIEDCAKPKAPGVSQAAHPAANSAAAVGSTTMARRAAVGGANTNAWIGATVDARDRRRVGRFAARSSCSNRSMRTSSPEPGGIRVLRLRAPRKTPGPRRPMPAATARSRVRRSPGLGVKASAVRLRVTIVVADLGLLVQVHGVPEGGVTPDLRLLFELAGGVSEIDLANSWSDSGSLLARDRRCRSPTCTIRPAASPSRWGSTTWAGCRRSPRSASFPVVAVGSVRADGRAAERLDRGRARCGTPLDINIGSQTHPRGR